MKLIVELLGFCYLIPICSWLGFAIR